MWIESDLEKVVSIIKGRKPNSVSSYKSEETPLNYVTIEAFEFGKALQFASEEKNSIITDEGEILIVWDGARFGMVGKSIGGVLGSTLAYLKPSEVLDKNYLHYFLLSKNKYLRSNQRGAGIPHLDSQLVKKLPFSLPPLSEQRRIVEILDQADEIRKLRKQADEKAEKIIPALFYEMFGEITKSKYPKKRLGEISKRVTKGESPNWQGFKYQESGIRFITSENVRDGFLDLQKSKFIPQAFDEKLTRSRLIEDDVLINLVGASIGRAAIVIKEALPANINQAVAAVTLDRSKILPSFLLNQILHPFIQGVIKGNIVEGARANISLTNIRDLEVIVPDIQTQIAFDKKASSISKIRINNLILIDKIENLFNLILSQAFDGSLTASWREAHIKEMLLEMEEQKKYLDKVN